MYWLKISSIYQEKVLHISYGILIIEILPIYQEKVYTQTRNENSSFIYKKKIISWKFQTCKKMWIHMSNAYYIQENRLYLKKKHFNPSYLLLWKHYKIISKPVTYLKKKDSCKKQRLPTKSYEYERNLYATIL